MNRILRNAKKREQTEKSGKYLIIMVWQSHLSGEVRAIVPVTQNHFDFA